MARTASTVNKPLCCVVDVSCTFYDYGEFRYSDGGCGRAETDADGGLRVC